MKNYLWNCSSGSAEWHRKGSEISIFDRYTMHDFGHFPSPFFRTLGTDTSLCLHEAYCRRFLIFFIKGDTSPEMAK